MEASHALPVLIRTLANELHRAAAALSAESDAEDATKAQRAGFERDGAPDVGTYVLALKVATALDCLDDNLKLDAAGKRQLWALLQRQAERRCAISRG